MKPEIVAHLDYFMNTLNIDHKNKTENPFENPNKYPALMYKMMVDNLSGSDVIMESQECSDSSSSDSEDMGKPIIDDDDLIEKSELNFFKHQNPKAPLQLIVPHG